ncbi:MAG: hypothetical protein FWD61_19280 [Phycisphaerales bacterium]|nr:hypothetical protein [Phycisphaerales bacterium]
MNRSTIGIFLFGLLALPVLAVIDVKLPLGKMYVDSKAITAGEITKMDDKILEIKPATQFKGKSPADLIKIQVKAPASLLGDLAGKEASKRVVIFDGDKTAAVHIGDHWYSAMLATRPGLYIIYARKPDYDAAFAGNTADLLKELAKLQAQDVHSSTTAPASPSTTAPATAPAK